MDEIPQFLVPWESRWRGFISAIPVAVSRSAPRIALEGRRPNLVPHLTESFLFHVLLIGAFCVFLEREVLPPPQILPVQNLTDVGIIYFQEKLPEVGDDDGSRAGTQGSAGGQTTFHPKQVIRVARGEQPATMVAYASPSIRLPISKTDLANILVMSRQLPVGPEAPLHVKTDAQSPTRHASPAVDPPKFAFGALPAEQPTLPSRLTVPKFVPTVETVSSATENALQTEAVPISTGREPSQASARASSANQIPGTEQSEAVVISVNPGTQVAFPGEDLAGVIVASPRGKNELGMGSGSSGSGIASGGGPGSGMTGTGPGSGIAGTGPGANSDATRGITAGPGSGGTGGATAGLNRGTGISVQNGVVLIPSFAGNGNSASATAPMPGLAPSSIVVVASARAGGGLSSYGALKGSAVYTTYVQTKVGTVVLQYSDGVRSDRAFERELSAPQPIHVDLPKETKGLRFVISCVLGKSGALQDIRFLDAPEPAVAQLMLSALTEWRFTPARRGNETVEVHALLGFHVGTR